MKSIFYAFLLALIFSSCALDPCGNVDAFTDRHEAFIDEVIAQVDDIDDEEWATKVDELDKMMTECYDKLKPKMTSAEKRKIIKNNTRFAMSRVEQNLDEIDLSDLKEQLSDVFDEDFQNQIGDIAVEVSEELKNVFDDDFKQKIKDVFDDEMKNDLQDAIDDLGDGLKEAVEAIKDAVDDIEIERN